MNDLPAPPIEIDCHAVQQMQQQTDDFLLLDCREQNEYDRVHLDGATFVPMSEIAGRLHELQPHRQRRIVVYCHLGGRSLRVAGWLREQGYAQTQSMAGGIDQWAKLIDASLPTY